MCTRYSGCTSAHAGSPASNGSASSSYSSPAGGSISSIMAAAAAVSTTAALPAVAAAARLPRAAEAEAAALVVRARGGRVGNETAAGRRQRRCRLCSLQLPAGVVRWPPGCCDGRQGSDQAVCWRLSRLACCLLKQLVQRLPDPCGRYRGASHCQLHVAECTRHDMTSPCGSACRQTNRCTAPCTIYRVHNIVLTSVLTELLEKSTS